LKPSFDVLSLPWGPSGLFGLWLRFGVCVTASLPDGWREGRARGEGRWRYSPLPSGFTETTGTKSRIGMCCWRGARDFGEWMACGWRGRRSKPCAMARKHLWGHRASSWDHRGRDIHRRAGPHPIRVLFSAKLDLGRDCRGRCRRPRLHHNRPV